MKPSMNRGVGRASELPGSEVLDDRSQTRGTYNKLCMPCGYTAHLSNKVHLSLAAQTNTPTHVCFPFQHPATLLKVENANAHCMIHWWREDHIPNVIYAVGGTCIRQWMRANGSNPIQKAATFPGVAENVRPIMALQPLYCRQPRNTLEGFRRLQYSVLTTCP